MTRKVFMVVLTLGLTSMVSGYAQLAGVSGNGRMPTLAEQLRQHNVDLTKSGLAAALRSSDVEVRELAALKLAEDNAKEAVPSIERAFVTETDEGARLNIAFALGQLRAASGISALTRACRNPALNSGLRLRAVRYMLDLGKDTCLTTVVDVLASEREDDATYRMEALSLVPDFTNLSKDDSRRILTSTLSALRDPAPAVRISSADALVRLGDAVALPYLQEAVAAEQDEAIREQLRSALERLEQRK